MVLVVVLALAACTESVAGRAMRATDRSSGLPTSAKPARARDLLLQDGDRAPFGQVTQSRVGDSYFTSAVPPECSAALLFKVPRCGLTARRTTPRRLITSPVRCRTQSRSMSTRMS